MPCLFVNACFREESRTRVLAQRVLNTHPDDIEEVDLAAGDIRPLDAESLARYNEAVAAHDFSDPMFDPAKEFAQAEAIVIAAPFYNYSIPAILHDYLEIVCTQGISFDILEDGTYVSLCKAKRLTFVTTAGGPITPDNDFAYAYIAALCRDFWRIEDVRLVKAEGLDIYGADVEALIAAVPVA